MVITEHTAVYTKSFLFDKSLFFSFTSIFLFFKCIFCFNFQIIFVLDIFIANNGYGLLLHYIFALQSRVTNLTLFIYSYGIAKLASIDMKVQQMHCIGFGVCIQLFVLNYAPVKTTNYDEK